MHHVVEEAVVSDPSHIRMPEPTAPPMPAQQPAALDGVPPPETKAVQTTASLPARPPPTNIQVVTPPMVPLRRDGGVAARAPEISNARRVLQQQQEKMQ